MVEIENLKQNIKISELAISLGLKVKNNKCLCVWHKEDTPSLTFNDEKGIYKCFGCGETGDIFTLYQKIKGVSFKEAFEALGGDQEKRITPVVKSIFEDFIGYLQAEGMGDEVLDFYKKKRGFSDEIIKKFNLCGIRDVEKTKYYLLKKHGKEKLMQAGLIGKQGFVFNNHPVIIPVYKNGKIVSVRGRCLDDRQPKYLQPIGIPLPIFNGDSTDDVVYLCEGELDAITMCQCGVTSLAIFGTNGFKNEFLEYFKDKDVVLCFDNDEAGKKATKDTAEKLSEISETIETLKIPEEMKDVSECFLNFIVPTTLSKDILKEGLRIKHLADIADEQGDDVLEKTHFDLLDYPMGGGIPRGGLAVIAAVAGEGKTSLMQTLTYHITTNNKTCLWFSYEERVSAIWNRLKKIGLNKSNVVLAPTDLSDNKLDFIEKIIKKQKKSEDFFFVMIDQLSFLAPKVDKNTNINSVSSNFALYLGEITKQLKNIAMEQNIIIFIAHQLGRTGELAYSDAIRHAPDKVIFIERELAPTGSENKYTDKSFLKINKNRPIGTTPIIPIKISKGKFVEYSGDYFIQKNV